jgi:TorA maturation chaperone TorD/DNA-binding transcriptional regulator YdaS (Cro superfamily)
LRDAGLGRAIDAAGGVAQLARMVGIAQPSVSNWSRVPAERVIAVETATGVSRAELRPDLYDESATPENTVVDPVDAARGREYGLLAALLSSSPPQALLDQIARLSDDATPLGRAHWALAEAASSAVASDVEREYFDLFVGLGRGELLPYASYYLTGFLNERPLSRLREDLVALDIERVESNFEPEDHAATLCEIMAGLATGRFPASPGMQAIFFAKHVAPWMSRMFADLEGAASARFYRSVGSLGRLFLEIETEAFTFAN